MATAITDIADASRAALAAGDVGSIPDPAMRAVLDSSTKVGAEIMRCQVLRILSAELDRGAALRIAELVMLVKV